LHIKPGSIAKSAPSLREEVYARLKIVLEFRSIEDSVPPRASVTGLHILKGFKGVPLLQLL
jgi:hypothetical protein